MRQRGEHVRSFNEQIVNGFHFNIPRDTSKQKEIEISFVSCKSDSGIGTS